VFNLKAIEMAAAVSVRNRETPPRILTPLLRSKQQQHFEIAISDFKRFQKKLKLIRNFKV
jgi:hypothetical protein